MKRIISLFAILACVTFSVFSQWLQINSPSSNSFYSVYFTNSFTGFINAYTLVIFKTTNEGTSWSYQYTGTNSTYYDILFLDMNTGFAVGSSGTIVETTNAGTNWSTRLTGSSTFNSISFPSASTGYAVGGTPASLYKSVDGGNTWTSLASPSNNTLRDVSFFTNTNGWVCGYNGTIMETTDGGYSWIPQFQSSSYNFERLYFYNILTGYVIGSGGTIMKTVNGGSNWTLSSSNVTTNLYGLTFADVNNGWVTGASGIIIHTTDGGNSWFQQTNPGGSQTAFYSISMTSLLYGYIVGSGGMILKTTNGGGQGPVFQRITTDPISNYSGYSDGAYPCDYDNDGYIDLLVLSYNDNCRSCNYPVYLFHNNGDGTFTRVTTGTLANLNIKAFCACWGDYDNDGLPDLFISRGFKEGNLLFHNDGNGNFTQVTTGPIATDAGDSRGCAWCDYDKDGWLDLFVCNQSNQSNFLYHNNGNGIFTKVSTGSIVTDVGWSRGCAWGDYDNDGWSDIYVTNYNNLNPFLYHNNGNGTFSRVYNYATISPGQGTQCSWGDYNNDGWLDLAVTNTNQFNRLFLNLKNGDFELGNSLVNHDATYIGNPAWEDFNNDGFLDLIVPNITNNYLYQNLNDSIIIHNTNELPANDNGNSATWFDANNDGKVDLYVTKNGANNSYFKNVGATANYITFKLHGCQPRNGYSNTTGIGARIKIYYGSNMQIREVGSNGPNNMLWQHFGLGSISVLDSVVVNWPSGLKQKLTLVNANQTMLIDECLVGIQNISNEIPKTFYIAQNYPNPFNPTTIIEYSIMKQTNVKITVYDIDGNLVKTLVNGIKDAGSYKIEFDGSNIASGIYFYKIETNNFTDFKKMVLIK